ncbi:hypothetical protein NN561_020351 [Cricetulus griseus]
MVAFPCPEHPGFARGGAAGFARSGEAAGSCGRRPPRARGAWGCATGGVGRPHRPGGLVTPRVGTRGPPHTVCRHQRAWGSLASVTLSCPTGAPFLRISALLGSHPLLASLGRTLWVELSRKIAPCKRLLS